MSTQDGGKSLLKNAKGETLNVEFLLDSPLFERIALPYQQQLELLGIGVTIKTIDSAQYERRTQTFDYDIVVGSWGQSLSPGNEQRDFWGIGGGRQRTAAAIYVGIKNPAIDKIIDAIIFAKNRKGLIAACKALDRVLIWNHYVVPMWYIPYERTARWDRFGKPDKLPDYSIGFPTIWWWDEETRREGARDDAARRGVGACAASLLAASGACRAAPRAFDFRRSQISRRISAHFDYVNPRCAQGRAHGADRAPWPIDTFDSFNGYILKGDPAQGIELMFDTLMARAIDEPDAVYGLVAKTADVAADRQERDFRAARGSEIRRWHGAHGGGCLRQFPAALDPWPREHQAHDHATSKPAMCWRLMKCATASRARIPATCRSSWRCCRFSPRPITASTISPRRRSSRRSAPVPTRSGASGRANMWLMSGAPIIGRRICRSTAGATISTRSASNISATASPGFEALKSGVLDLREEYTSREWATAYDFPALKDGRVKQAVLPDETPSGAQGFFFNLRREKFQDIRVRKASISPSISNGRTPICSTASTIAPRASSRMSPLKAEGAPPPEELAILEPMRDKLRPEVFGEAELPPVSDGSGQDRKLLRAGLRASR